MANSNEEEINEISNNVDIIDDENLKERLEIITSFLEKNKKDSLEVESPVIPLTSGLENNNPEIINQEEGEKKEIEEVTDEEGVIEEDSDEGEIKVENKKEDDKYFITSKEKNSLVYAEPNHTVSGGVETYSQLRHKDALDVLDNAVTPYHQTKQERDKLATKEKGKIKDSFASSLMLFLSLVVFNFIFGGALLFVTFYPKAKSILLFLKYDPIIIFGISYFISAFVIIITAFIKLITGRGVSLFFFFLAFLLIPLFVGCGFLIGGKDVFVCTNYGVSFINYILNLFVNFRVDGY